MTLKVDPNGTITLNDLSSVLNQLLAAKKIKPMELARQTNVPQPTIQRIVAGTTTKPHPSSLEPIAKYFSINMDQLLGLEPIPWLENIQKRIQARGIPLVDWSQVTSWLDTFRSNSSNKPDSNVVISDANVGKKAFGLVIKDSSMEPLFSIGTKIIIDPEKEVKDRCFVVAKLHESKEATFRQLIIDGSNYFLKPLSQELREMQITKLHSDDKICGILVQAKRDFDEA